MHSLPMSTISIRCVLHSIVHEQGELKQILYPLFKCIILFNEVREKEQKREFFEKYASKLTTSANESEMRILRQYVNGMVVFSDGTDAQALGFFKSTLDQWKCDPIPLTLSSRAVTFLKNVLEGEVLRGMQDYLVSVVFSFPSSRRNSRSPS